MELLKDYWWIFILALIIGVLINTYEDLKKIDYKKYITNKNDLNRRDTFNKNKINDQHHTTNRKND
ncbi:hypothetical protein [Pantoea sp. Aalb]|uniref:hypothetical protein n=1 Tax=Pantoea sp. Aalb TaxID=2576762 RepID=UPI0013261C55|nr:hypothetical protein [Pantoea sp. Aalb]MXP67272.1 YpfN family protein [Pantoea sp. Aalb]